MDVQPLLSSRGDDEPSGENLEYDMDFIIARAGRDSRARSVQAGDEILRRRGSRLGRRQGQGAGGAGTQPRSARRRSTLAQAVLNIDGLHGLCRSHRLYPRAGRAVLGHLPPAARRRRRQRSDHAGQRGAEPRRRPRPCCGLLRRAPLAESRSFGRVSLRDIHGRRPARCAGRRLGATDSGHDLGGVPGHRSEAAGRAAGGGAGRGRQRHRDRQPSSATEMPGQGPDFDDLIKTLADRAGILADQGVGGEAEADAGDAAGAVTAAGDSGRIAPWPRRRRRLRARSTRPATSLPRSTGSWAITPARSRRARCRSC